MQGVVVYEGSKVLQGLCVWRVWGVQWGSAGEEKKKRRKEEERKGVGSGGVHECAAGEEKGEEESATWRWRRREGAEMEKE